MSDVASDWSVSESFFAVTSALLLIKGDDIAETNRLTTDSALRPIAFIVSRRFPVIACAAQSFELNSTALVGNIMFKY